MPHRVAMRRCLATGRSSWRIDRGWPGDRSPLRQWHRRRPLSSLRSSLRGSKPPSPDLAARVTQLEAELAAARAEIAAVAERFDRAVETAKLEALKEFAYGAGHEINNPLANIAARAQTLLKRALGDDADKLLTAIHRQALRAHDMIADLMLFARPPAIVRSPVDLTALAMQVLAELRPLATERGILLRLESRGELATLRADATQLAVALRAVVENAIEAIGERGAVDIRIDEPSSGFVSVVVRDTGPGIPADVRPRIFDPFFSGREAGRGLGFGLSKCWRIVTNHGGSIDVRSPESGGAEFVLSLPVA